LHCTYSHTRILNCALKEKVAGPTLSYSHTAVFDLVARKSVSSKLIPHGKYEVSGLKMTWKPPFLYNSTRETQNHDDFQLNTGFLLGS
jgi:hypothetical protein